MRVVVSLTSIPSRLGSENFVKVLDSIKGQEINGKKVDAIYLAIPNHSKRFDCPYPCFKDDDVKIVMTEDYGPMTKLMGGLLNEDDGETVIVTCDDDVIYPAGWIGNLVQRLREGGGTEGSGGDWRNWRNWWTS